VTISCSWGAALTVLYSPVGLVVQRQEVQLIEIVICELTAPQRSSEDEEEVVNGDGAVCGSVGWRLAVAFQLLPLF
jgi:hypothetical protein